MANTIQQLTEKVDALQAALDAEQEQIAAAIAKLQATIDELESGSGNGTEEERQALADKLDAIVFDLKATVPDAEEPPQG